jgi:hypothetical protein
VNINTIVGRRVPATSSTPPFNWSEVYDGIMHRYPVRDPVTQQLVNADSNLKDASGNVLQLSHFGPAWRDVVLSRRGYAQFNPGVSWPDDTGDIPPPTVEKSAAYPDVFAFGLNPNFPSFFSNPFRSADAGDLVPLVQMMRSGVDASLMRGHHYARAREVEAIDVGGTKYSVRTLTQSPFRRTTTHYLNGIQWGLAGVDDDLNGVVDDVREAGYGLFPPIADNDLALDDGVSGPATQYQDGDWLVFDDLTTQVGALGSSGIPLFSESLPEPAIDAERNPYMMYQPMSRLGNLVTTRSNVYAIWVTIGYFEVEKAPDWNDPDDDIRDSVRARFGATDDNNEPETIVGRALYDRVYPEGYALGQELGIDTGTNKRQRAFYIIDRTEPVGFKPGEDLNAERVIRVRRRIE